jgi:hypothetical protein
MDDAKRTERQDTEVDADLIDAVREIARQQGRDVGSLVDEALTEFVRNKRQTAQGRPSIKAAHKEVLEQYHDVFKKLAE